MSTPYIPHASQRRYVLIERDYFDLSKWSTDGHTTRTLPDETYIEIVKLCGKFGLSIDQEPLGNHFETVDEAIKTAWEWYKIHLLSVAWYGPQQPPAQVDIPKFQHP